MACLNALPILTFCDLTFSVTKFGVVKSLLMMVYLFQRESFDMFCGEGVKGIGRLG